MKEYLEIKQVKDFRILLKDMKGFVQPLKPLLTGRALINFKMLPREIWGNFLLCVALQEIYGQDITFAEDVDGDGIILDKKTKEWIRTEHVSALDNPQGKILPSGEARVIEAINLKINKGPDYAKNKFLIVFFDGAGKWYRNKVREGVNGRHNFMGIFLIGLLTSGNDGYEYSITHLGENDSISYKVKINSKFTDWDVLPMQ